MPRPAERCSRSRGTVAQCYLLSFLRTASGLSPAAMTRRQRSGRRQNRSRLPRGKKKSGRQPKNWKTSRQPVRRVRARRDGLRPSGGDQARAALITSKKVLRTDFISLVAACNGIFFVSGKNLQNIP